MFVVSPSTLLQCLSHLELTSNSNITENSDDPYLHFLASSTLKEGIMREWAMLGNDEIDQLRDYLLNYTHQHLK